MSNYAGECINCVPNIENLSYLELGLEASKNFDIVRAREKVSVDINPNLPKPPTFCMSTDDFFAQNKRRFDVVFIDAGHKVEQVVKDVANSMAVCDKMLFIHDLYPDSIRTADNPLWAGDGYKMLAFWIRYILHFPIINFQTLSCDSGLTAVKPPFPLRLMESLLFCDYKEFEVIAKESLVRLNLDQFKDWIKQ